MLLKFNASFLFFSQSKTKLKIRQDFQTHFPTPRKCRALVRMGGGRRKMLHHSDKSGPLIDSISYQYQAYFKTIYQLQLPATDCFLKLFFFSSQMGLRATSRNVVVLGGTYHKVGDPSLPSGSCGTTTIFCWGIFFALNPLIRKYN